MIDLYSTPCTYFHRVRNSGTNADVSLNRQTNVLDGLFALSDEAKKSITELRHGIDNGKIIVNGTSYTDKAKAKEANIPMITGNCVTSPQSHADIQAPNGLMFLDIDSVENLEIVKSKVNALPYTVLSAESVSGHGIFAVFATDSIKDKNDYKQCFWAAMAYLEQEGLADCAKAVLDNKCCNLNRPRFVTIDPKPYYNPNAQLWTERAELNTTAPSKKREPREKVKKESKEPREPDFSNEILTEYWAAKSIVDFKNNHIDLVREVAFQTPFVAVEGKDYLIRDGINCQMPRDYVRDKGQIIGYHKWGKGLNEKFAIACAVVKYRHPNITADEFFLTMLQEFLTYYEVPSIDRRQTLSIIASGWRSNMTPQAMRKRNFKVNLNVAKAQGKTSGQLLQTAKKHYKWDYVYNPATLYNDTITITENVKAMAEQGHPIDRKTLKNALTEQGIMTFEQFNDYSALLMYPLEVSDGYIAEKCHLSRPTVNKRRNEWWQQIEAQQDTKEEVEEQLRIIGYNEADERKIEELFSKV